MERGSGTHGERSRDVYGPFKGSVCRKLGRRWGTKSGTDSRTSMFEECEELRVDSDL